MKGMDFDVRNHVPPGACVGLEVYCYAIGGGRLAVGVNYEGRAVARLTIDAETLAEVDRQPPETAPKRA